MRLAALVPLALLVPAAAGDGGIWMASLSSQTTIVDSITGDVDGDGADETILCTVKEGTEPESDIVVLKGKPGAQRPVFHVELEATRCEKVRLNGKKLGVLLAGKRQLVWTYGTDMVWTTDKASPLFNVKASASSSLAGTTPAEAFDGDLTTSWAEGTSGTGIGASLTLRFGKPIDVAAIGIFAGNGRDARSFFDDNRVHRGSIIAKTEDDLGDSASGLDFSSRGIDTLGDHSEFACENRPQVTYVHVGKKGVRELQVRIDSVYLGDKHDNTRIAEIEVVPLLGLSDTVDKSTGVTAPKPKKPDAKAESKGDDSKADDASSAAAADAVKKLDEGGRSVVHDDL